MSTSASFTLPSSAASVRGPAPGLRRYIDPKTRDYVVEGGQLKQDDGFTSEVVLALATRLGSALALPTFGSRLHEIKRADERGRRLAEKHAMKALAHLERKVQDLRIEAALPKDKLGAITLTVTGRRGADELSVDYTAVLGG